MLRGAPLNRGSAYARFVRDVGQAIVPYALIACMAIGVKTIRDMGGEETVRVLRDMRSQMESRHRASEIRIEALERVYGDHD